jgi:hypothetical protein
MITQSREQFKPGEAADRAVAKSERTRVFDCNAAAYLASQTMAELVTATKQAKKNGFERSSRDNATTPRLLKVDV